MFHLTRKLTGDEEFDRKFTVENPTSPLLKRILAVHNLRQGLLEVSSKAKGVRIKISPVEIEFQEKDLVTEVDYLQAVMDMTNRLKKALPNTTFD